MTDIVKVTAAILVKDKKIIIAKRGPDDRLAHKWEFPGGKVEINETPERCLKREMKEEFDIDVTALEIGDSVTVADLSLGEAFTVQAPFLPNAPVPVMRCTP